MRLSATGGWRWRKEEDENSGGNGGEEERELDQETNLRSGVAPFTSARDQRARTRPTHTHSETEKIIQLLCDLCQQLWIERSRVSLDPTEGELSLFLELHRTKRHEACSIPIPWSTTGCSALGFASLGLGICSQRPPCSFSVIQSTSDLT